MMNTTENLDALFSLMGEPARRTVFQALCTEVARLDEAGVSAEHVTVVRDMYARALTADTCCGQLLATHAYC